MNSNSASFGKWEQSDSNSQKLSSKQIKKQQTLGDYDFAKERRSVPTFFERQQNEAVNLFNADSTTLQMALANKLSVPAMKHQFMQDLIALSKKPTATENFNLNMSFGLNQIRSLSDSELEELINGRNYDDYDDYSNERFEEEGEEEEENNSDQEES